MTSVVSAAGSCCGGSCSCGNSFASASSPKQSSKPGGGGKPGGAPTAAGDGSSRKLFSASMLSVRKAYAPGIRGFPVCASTTKNSSREITQSVSSCTTAVFATACHF